MFSLRHIPQEHLQRLFAAHFPGVDVPLDVDACLARRQHGLGTRAVHVAHYRQGHGTPFYRGAKRGELDQRRGFGHGVEKSHHVVVCAGFLVIRSLGTGQEILQTLTGDSDGKAQTGK